MEMWSCKRKVLSLFLKCLKLRKLIRKLLWDEVRGTRCLPILSVKVAVLWLSTLYLYCFQGNLVGIHMGGSPLSCFKMGMKLQLKTSSQDKLALPQKKSLLSCLSYCATACFSFPSLPQPQSSCGSKLNCFGNLSQLKLAIFMFVQLHIREGRQLEDNNWG